MKKLPVYLAIALSIIMTLCVKTMQAQQPCNNCPNQQNVGLATQQQPTIFVSELPTAIGAHNGVDIYLDEPPTTDLFKRKGVGHIWVLSADGTPVKIGVQVEIINVSAGQTWDRTFIGVIDPYTGVVTKPVVYPKRVPGNALAVYSGNPNKPISYKFTL